MECATELGKGIDIMKMKRFTYKVLAIAILLIAMALVLTPVSAELKISLTIYDTSNPNGAGNFYSQVIKDSDDGSTDGFIALPNGALITGLNVYGSTHTSIHGLPAILSSGSSKVANQKTTPVRIYAAVSDTDYTPPVDFADVSGSGTFTHAKDSSICMRWYDDPANGQGADYAFADFADFDANKGLLTPGNLLDSYCYTAPSVNVNSFSHNNGPISVHDVQPYSMTLLFDYTLMPGGSYESALTSRGQNMSKYVPEFPTLAMPTALLIGLVGAVWFIRKTKED